jgi:hypothetical protein
MLKVKAILFDVKSNVTGHHAGKKGTDKKDSEAKLNAMSAIL